MAVSGDKATSVDLAQATLTSIEKLVIQNGTTALDSINIDNNAFQSIDLKGMANWVSVDNVLASSAVTVQGSKSVDSSTTVNAADASNTSVTISNTLQGTGANSSDASATFNNDLAKATTVNASLSALDMNADSKGYSWADQYITTAAANAKITSNVLIDGATSDGSDYSGVDVYVEHDGTAAVTLNATIKNSDSVELYVYADDNGYGTQSPTNVANVTLNNVVNSSGDNEVYLSDFGTVNVMVDGKSELQWLETYGNEGADFTSQALNIVANADLKVASYTEMATTGSTTLTVTGKGNVDLGSFYGTEDALSSTITSTIDASGLTGNLTVNVENAISSFKGGSGNDTVTLQSALAAGHIIDGGAGVNSLKFDNVGGTLIAQDYALINGTVLNFQKLEFNNGLTLDASKLTGTYSAFTFDGNSTVTKVNGQALTAEGNLTATVSGYDASATPKAYGGALDITAKGNGSTITAAADTATVTVKAGTADVGVTVAGDLKSGLTINTVNAANSATDPTADTLASASLTIVKGNTSNLGALTTLTLTGNGTVTVDNSNETGSTANAATSLKTIDASALGGTLAYGAGKGDITGGLTFTGNGNVAESIKLGSGQDIINITGSTFGTMDTITGFDATKETNDDKSVVDTLIFAGLTLNGKTANAGIEKITIDTTIYTTLALAFTHAAAVSSADSKVVQFSYGNDTYLFKDSGADAGLLDNTDAAVKLVGHVDLTVAFSVFAA